MNTDESMGNSSLWTEEQEKAFENALVINPEDSIDRWEKIAEAVPGKTVEEIKHHYELLVEDINSIESGLVSVPNYNSTSEGLTDHGGEGGTSKKGIHLEHVQSDSNHGSKASSCDQERRKGIAWTEDEHRLFLLGLDKYGKGDWRSISRNFVVSRTPTQVASHAQKYFIRLNSMNKDRRRSSIHDITSMGSGDVSTPQGPITGQANGATVGGSSSKSTKQQPQPPPSAPGVGVYGAPTIGQPIGGPPISAVGTPVFLSPPSHMVYGVRAPVTGQMVPGVPTSMPAMTYPMPHSFLHPADSTNPKLLQWLCKEEIRKRDTDKDRKLNFKEFFHGLFDLVQNHDDEGHHSSHHSDDSMEASAKLLFRQFDQDGDGYLSHRTDANYWKTSYIRALLCQTATDYTISQVKIQLDNSLVKTRKDLPGSLKIISSLRDVNGIMGGRLVMKDKTSIAPRFEALAIIDIPNLEIKENSLFYLKDIVIKIVCIDGSEIQQPKWIVRRFCLQVL